MENNQKIQYDEYVFLALREAEKEAESANNWITPKEIKSHIEKQIKQIPIWQARL